METLEITDVHFGNTEQIFYLINKLPIKKLIARCNTNEEIYNLLYLHNYILSTRHVPNVFLIFNNYIQEITNGQIKMSSKYKYEKIDDTLIFSGEGKHITILSSHFDNNLIKNCEKYIIKYTPKLEYISVFATCKNTMSLKIDPEIFQNLKAIYVNGNISFEQDLSSCQNLIYWNLFTTSKMELPCNSEYYEVFDEDLIKPYYRYINMRRVNTLLISKGKLSFDNVVYINTDNKVRNYSEINIDDYNPLSIRIVNTEQESTTLLTSKTNITHIECRGQVNIKFANPVIIEELHITSDDSNVSIDGKYEINKLYTPIYLKNQIKELKYNCKIIKYNSHPYFNTDKFFKENY